MSSTEHFYRDIGFCCLYLFNNLTLFKFPLAFVEKWISYNIFNIHNSISINFVMLYYIHVIEIKIPFLIHSAGNYKIMLYPRD